MNRFCSQRASLSPAFRSAGIVSLLTAALLLAPSASRGAESLLLSNAIVHTVTGPVLTNGQVLVQNGSVEAVGTDLATAGAPVVDLAGQHLFPGLIALNTVLGLTEIESVRGTEDVTESGDYTPDVQSWIAVNPDSELLPAARANGIAYFEPVPHAGLVAGHSGLLRISGWTTEEMSFKKPLALHVYWPAMDLDTAPRRRGSVPKSAPKSVEEQAKARAAKLRDLVGFFEEAKAYARARDAAAPGSPGEPGKVPAWEAMLPVVNGQLPVVLHADESRQIRSAIEWAATNQFRVLLAGGRDAALLASRLAELRIPVIYGHIFTLPQRDTASYDSLFSAPAILHRAGVKVALSIGWDIFNAPLVRNLPYAAAQAAAFGLPPEEALKAITLYPAQMTATSGRLGSIEPGKEATFFSATGDILDARTQVKRMWIAGNEVQLADRQTRLYERYKSRPRQAGE